MIAQSLSRRSHQWTKALRLTVFTYMYMCYNINLLVFSCSGPPRRAAIKRACESNCYNKSVDSSVDSVLFLPPLSLFRSGRSQQDKGLYDYQRLRTLHSMNSSRRLELWAFTTAVAVLALARTRRAPKGAEGFFSFRPCLYVWSVIWGFSPYNLDGRDRTALLRALKSAQRSVGAVCGACGGGKKRQRQRGRRGGKTREDSVAE